MRIGKNSNSPWRLRGFIDIVRDADELLGGVLAEVGVDGDGEVVQVIHLLQENTVVLF